MTVAFLNIGSLEFGLLLIALIIALLIVIAVGNYGKNTALGYWGSVLLSLLISPIIVFIIIFFLKRSKNNISSDS